ncbi:outer membrane protein assembly factor BamB [Alteromonas halophila]|uniref:Outer membrane protein assembly factor BamB n=1 Tax=Alteromonas halophila TaxID=516698 RepID=A0A918JLZ9_9ALTE|nr:outer membrane protein assembly factor BamB [Alteromonas halophila]GGW86438.1 outer membrane protein assembly factor BamB [Alteromonas halophila]
MFHTTRGRNGQCARALSLALLMSVTLTGCSTVEGWFTDEEELEIRRLKPIEQQFEPSVRWDTDIGDGVDYYFSRLRPVYADDTLFVADRHGDVKALDPKNGEEKWERNFAVYRDEGMMSAVSKLWSSGESARIAGMAHGDGKLFIGSENGLVMALDAESGETLWTAIVPGEVLAAPALGEGILVVNTGAGSLFGFDAESGEQLWVSEGETPPLTLRGISAPVIVSGGALLGTATGKLQVNILGSGAVAWETAIGKPAGATELERIVDVDTTPLLFGGIAYTISYSGTLAAVELRSGRIIWKREYGAYRDISREGNALFVVDNKSNIYALDRRNGIELWSQGSLKGRSVTAAEPVGDYVVVGDNWGFVHWLDADSGKIVARLDIGGDDEDEAVYVAPLNVNGDLIIVTRDGEVVSVRTP